MIATLERMFVVILKPFNLLILINPIANIKITDMTIAIFITTFREQIKRARP